MIVTSPGDQRYKPQTASLQAIVRQFGDSLIRRGRLNSIERQTLWSLGNCRTPTMGGHVEHCEQCEFVRYQYHSCRSRHCPQCQSQASNQWRVDREKELLPAPYFHHVFTLPHKLNRWILRSPRNYRQLVKLLFGAAAQTLLQFGRSEFGGQLGITMVLHTWDQRLRPHFHVHCIVPSGALTNGGTQWIAGGHKFLFSVKALSKVFRAKYLDGLRQLISGDKIDVPSDCQALSVSIGKGYFKCLSRRFRGPWVVYAQKPFAGPKKLLNYLSRYVHRSAISNDRIQAIDGENVKFSFRDRADGDRKKTETLGAVQFLERFLLHVLPKGLTRIRHYGFLSNRVKQKSLDCCRQLLGAKEPDVEPKRSLVEWFLELTGIDLRSCPSCGSKLTKNGVSKVPVSMAMDHESRQTPLRDIDSS